MATKQVGIETGDDGQPPDNVSLPESTSSSSQTDEENNMPVPPHNCFVPETGRTPLRWPRYCTRCGFRLSPVVYGDRNGPIEEGGSSDSSSTEEMDHECWENRSMGVLLRPRICCHRCGLTLHEARYACDEPECHWVGEEDDVNDHYIHQHL